MIRPAPRRAHARGGAPAHAGAAPARGRGRGASYQHDLPGYAARRATTTPAAATTSPAATMRDALDRANEGRNE